MFYALVGQLILQTSKNMKNQVAGGGGISHYCSTEWFIFLSYVGYILAFLPHNSGALKPVDPSWKSGQQDNIPFIG